MHSLIRVLISLQLAFTVYPLTAIADNSNKQIIQHGFDLREQAFLIQNQANNMIRSSRKLDKTAIQLRQNAKQSKQPTNTINPEPLNQASRHLNHYSSTFRSAHNELIDLADTLLHTGFFNYWQPELIHTDPMHIAGSFKNGETSDLLKMSFSAQNKPEALDLSIGQISSKGLYYIIIQSLLHPLQINQLHTWKIIVSDKNADPAADLTLSVLGDMPSHGHGMPTTPKITAQEKPGIYLLEGVKFQMRGWWVISLTLTGKQGSDTVNFNLDL